MSLGVTDLVGYRYEPARKSWLGAFFIGAFGQAAEAGKPTKPQGHYELLDLAQITARAEQAVISGDRDAELEYGTAANAIQETVDGKRATPHDLPVDFRERLFSSHNHELFKVVDPVADYDWTEFRRAQKTAQVHAEFVGEGTRVETIMANGLVETSKTAGPGGGYKVTAQIGEQYLVDKAKFEKLYNETDAPDIYAPKPDVRKVLELKDNVAFTAPWGEEMRIRGGGVLVHGGKKDVYGIQPDEFKASYSMAMPG